MHVECLWKLCRMPSIGFYRKLHTYFKQKKLSKGLIGKLYSVIDFNFKEGRRLDNIYRFVDNIASSKRQSSDPMVYNSIPVANKSSSMLAECSQQLEELNAECADLK